MIWVLILIIIIGLLLFYKAIKSPLMKKLISSFDNTSNGFSARKLSAFVGVFVSIIATFKFVNNQTIIEALMVWLCFALLCLGIITAEQVIRFRNKSSDTPIETPKSEEIKPQEGDPKI